MFPEMPQHDCGTVRAASSQPCEGIRASSSVPSFPQRAIESLPLHGTGPLAFGLPRRQPFSNSPRNVFSADSLLASVRGIVICWIHDEQPPTAWTNLAPTHTSTAYVLTVPPPSTAHPSVESGWAAVLSGWRTEFGLHHFATQAYE
jgi:hypothetical protein